MDLQFPLRLVEFGLVERCDSLLLDEPQNWQRKQKNRTHWYI